jgi:DcuC family C4-dicarboxylate transporter
MGKGILTLVEIVIGIIVAAVRYIIKVYSATGVLFVSGLISLIASARMGIKFYLATPGVPVTPLPILLNILMLPKLTHSSGINPTYLSIPILQTSHLGRTISPVSGVVVAVAGMAPP